MPLRVVVILLNTYREAVRAKVLHGLFAVAVATAAYCVVVGHFAANATGRVLSDLGSASVALYGAFVAIVLSATTLHRELEQKTLFPILARPISRVEYLVGKYLGTVLTLLVFVVGNSAVFLIALAATVAEQAAWALTAVGGVLCVAGFAAWRLPAARSALPALAALAMAACGWLLCGSEVLDDRRVVALSALLTALEVSVVAAVALLFASFSSPFLTGVFTLGVFIVGRSADTLAHLPGRVFGEAVAAAGQQLARVVPNLMLYVPERSVLTGEAGVGMGYAGLAAIQTLGWSLVLLAAAGITFRRRDLV